MRRRLIPLRLTVLVCFAIVLPGNAPATDTPGHTLRRIELSGHGTLVLLTPSAWRVSATRAAHDMPPTIELSPETGEAFSAQITVMWLPTPEALQPSGIKKLVKAARRNAPRSTERKSEIRQFQGKTLAGYYFSAVDSEPAPGEWRYMTQGSAVLEDLLLSFTVLSNDPSEPEAAETLKILQSATRIAPARTTPIEIAIPNEGWFISFEAPPLTEVTQSDHSGDFSLSGTSHRFNLSLFVEKPRDQGKSHRDCRDYYWSRASKNPRIVKKSISFSENDRYARVQCDTRASGILQTHVNYYFAFRDKWVDVHISLADPTPEDQQIFETFDKTLRYGPSEAPNKTSD